MSRPSPLHTHIFEPGSAVPAKSKMKLSHGVAAGAEDSKYQAKYKDLKKKVKELEADNDRLHFKVLEARKNVTRMKLERAVLYERLCAVPPTDEEASRGLQDPPIGVLQSHHPPAGSQHARHDHPESRDPSVVEYIRNHSRPGGRLGTSDNIPAPTGLDINRHRVQPPPPPFARDQHDQSRFHSHSQNHAAIPAPSRSSRRHEIVPAYHYPPPPELGHLDTFPHSNAGGGMMAGEPTKERQRRPEMHESDSHPHLPRIAPPHSPPRNGDNRAHHHQRIGSGAHHNNIERDHDRHPEVEREIEQDRSQPQLPSERASNRIPTPPFAQRTYTGPIYRDADNTPSISSHRTSADQEMTHELVGPGLHPPISRSNTPGSIRTGSGPAPSSRPHSRLIMPEERGEEMEVEDGPETRKRLREEGSTYLNDERTAKRPHQEDATSANSDRSRDVSMDAADP